ncbi:MAG: hypothetical protein ABJN62_02600 [Halioglobus sp.]
MSTKGGAGGKSIYTYTSNVTGYICKMLHFRRLRGLILPLFLIFPSIIFCSLATAADEADLLRAKIATLESELSLARSDLEKVLASQGQSVEQSLEQQPMADSEPAQGGMVIGPVTIGGAMRVNYVYGSYEGVDGGPSRGGDGGNVELDTFRINASLDAGPWLGKLEYRWYPASSGKSYSFFHTGWLGYQLDNDSHLEVGLNRVPFGAGPYGISQSWFFDQHYYVGLADDPDLGIKYSSAGEDWSWDAAYYWRSEPSFFGRSEDSTRYGYDAVRWRETVAADGSINFDERRSGYRERDQGNLRLIRHLKGDDWELDLGSSLQYGKLQGSGVDDGSHWAGSVHAVSRLENFILGLQVSRYGLDIDEDNPWRTDELIPFGAYDFAWPVATDSWLPAVSLSYRIDTPQIPWLDYVLPYLEYSSIIKLDSQLNDSELAVVGAAWASGGWYIYSDLAYSNGNYFVGDEGDDYGRIDGVGDFGVSGNSDWNYRFNINFGYYY